LAPQSHMFVGFSCSVRLACLCFTRDPDRFHTCKCKYSL